MDAVIAFIIILVTVICFYIGAKILQPIIFPADEEKQEEIF